MCTRKSRRGPIQTTLNRPTETFFSVFYTQHLSLTCSNSLLWTPETRICRQDARISWPNTSHSISARAACRCNALCRRFQTLTRDRLLRARLKERLDKHVTCTTIYWERSCLCPSSLSLGECVKIATTSRICEPAAEYILQSTQQDR